MKRLILISLSIILLLSVGCSGRLTQMLKVPSMELDKVVTLENRETEQADGLEGLDEVIGSYLEEKLGYKTMDGMLFEAHELYGTQARDGKIYAYLWSRVQEYSFMGDIVKDGAGMSLPVVVVLEKSDSDSLIALEFMVPKDGERYTASVRELFPEEYREKILTRANVNGLDEIVRQKAENYYSELKKDGINIYSDGQNTSSAGQSAGRDGELLTGTGIYNGQIDNNSIEIDLATGSGTTATAFRFSDAVREKFESLGLKTGDKVKVSYIRNGYDQLVISELEKAAE